MKLMVDRLNYFLNQREKQEKKTTIGKKMAEQVLDNLPLVSKHMYSIYIPAARKFREISVFAK